MGLEDRERYFRDGDARVLKGEDPREAFGDAYPALRALVVALADNKFVLGRRYGEWACSGPTLEASVSAAAMAGDEMGHARALYPLFREFPDAPKALERETDRDDIHRAAFLGRSLPSWPAFIAANALFDLALSTLIESAVDSAYAPLRHPMKKILQEEAFHHEHATGWMEALAGMPGARAETEERVREIWPEALGWFGPDDDETLARAAAAGIVADDAGALATRFVAAAEQVLEPLGALGLPGPGALDWSGWDPARRRLVP